MSGERLDDAELARLERVLLEIHSRSSEEFEMLEDETLRQGDRSDVAPGDEAAAQSGDEVNLHLLEMDDERLRDVTSALQRIREGTFGACEVCGEAVDRARLRAIPWTNTCLRCQKEQERLHPLPE